MSDFFGNHMIIRIYIESHEICEKTVEKLDMILRDEI